MGYCLAITFDQVLVKIPARHIACFLSKLLKQWVSIAATYRTRCQHNKGYAIVDVANLSGFVFIFGFLVKIVGREADNFKTLGLIFLIQGLKTFELSGKTTMACRVNNKNNLTLEVVAEIDFLIRAQLLRRVVEQGIAVSKSAGAKRSND